MQHGFTRACSSNRGSGAGGGAVRIERWCAASAVSVLLALAACAGPPPSGPREVLTPAERRGLASGAHGASVRVVVVDGGIDAAHPALRDRVTRVWGAPGLAAGASAHGTQLAGIVGGRATDTWSGGLADRSLLLDVQVLDEAGQGSAADLAAGLNAARAAGADLVLTSLALDGDDPEVRSAVSGLTGDGTVVVAAGGNGFEDRPAYPAAYPGVLGVAALDRGGRRLQLSGWSSADVAVPGEAVLAPTTGGGYEAVSGTSAAAAVAAGLLAACGGAEIWVGSAPAPHWTNGSVVDAGRARPRLTCPGHDDDGGR